MSTAPQTTEDLRAAAIAAEQPAAPAAPPEPQYTELDGIKVGKSADGKFEAVLPTGARYVGDSETQLALNIAKGKVEADKTIHSLKQQPAAPVVAPTVPAEAPEVIEARNYLLNETARGLGFKDADELKQYVGVTGQVTQNQQLEQIAAGFQNLCPEFPESPENNETLLTIAEQNQFPMTPMGLRAAHMIAVAEKKYSPLNDDQIRAQRMQALGLPLEAITPKTPAPMLPTGAPASSTTGTFDPMDPRNSIEAVREWAMNAARQG